MVTLSKIGGQYNYLILEIQGLSSDEKPTESIGGIVISNGSKFKEIDTGKEYLFNYAQKSWCEIANSASSQNGKDGITPKLQKSETAIQVSYDNGESFEDLVLLDDIKGEKGADGKAGTQGAAGIPGAKGADGIDGISPTVTTSAVDGGTKVTITDKSGLHEFTVLNGKDGSNGKNGTQGEKGASVQSIKLVKDENGDIVSGTVTLTDATEVEITITTE